MKLHVKDGQGFSKFPFHFILIHHLILYIIDLTLIKSITEKGGAHLVRLISCPSAKLLIIKGLPAKGAFIAF